MAKSVARDTRRESTADCGPPGTAGAVVHFTSPHYDGWPGVQIRLELIEHDDLRERPEDAWLIQAPKRLAAEYVEANRS